MYMCVTVLCHLNHSFGVGGGGQSKFWLLKQMLECERGPRAICYPVLPQEQEKAEGTLNGKDGKKQFSACCKNRQI